MNTQPKSTESKNTQSNKTFTIPNRHPQILNRSSLILFTRLVSRIFYLTIYFEDLPSAIEDHTYLRGLDLDFL